MNEKSKNIEMWPKEISASAILYSLPDAVFTLISGGRGFIKYIKSLAQIILKIFSRYIFKQIKMDSERI